MPMKAPVAVVDRATLGEELTRIADICHGCRRCFALCPSFDILFKGLDADEVDGDAGKLPARVLEEFVDFCYECRLCLPHCPYTPPHRWSVDVPRLVLEARRVRVEERGVPFRDRVLSRPDAAGRAGTLLAPVANFVNTLPLARRAMERTIGIAAGKSLPTFASQTFTSWFAGRFRPVPAVGAPKVVLFPTCSVEWNRTGIGKAAVQVLEKNGVEVAVDYPRCCGMPFLDVGDVASADEARRAVVSTMKGWIDRGYTVVTPGPSCSLMLRKEYGWLGKGDPMTAAVASGTRDLAEFLMELKAKGLLDTTFPNPPVAVAYHLPCHLKVQNIGFRSRDLLALTGARVTMAERCSGHDGTWAMKREYFEESMRVGQKLFDDLAGAGAEVLASDCPLAGLQIRQGTGRPVQHPIEVVRDAYGLEPA